MNETMLFKNKGQICDKWNRTLTIPALRQTAINFKLQKQHVYIASVCENYQTFFNSIIKMIFLLSLNVRWKHSGETSTKNFVESINWTS